MVDDFLPSFCLHQDTSLDEDWLVSVLTFDLLARDHVDRATMVDAL